MWRSSPQLALRRQIHEPRSHMISWPPRPRAFLSWASQGGSETPVAGSSASLGNLRCLVHSPCAEVANLTDAVPSKVVS